MCRDRTRLPETSLCRLRITSRVGFPSTPAFTALTRAEPNFQSNVGPENVRQPVLRHGGYFFAYLSLVFATYHLVTSYTFERVQSFFLVERKLSERCSEHACSKPCSEHDFSEEFQFSLTSRTVLVGEYRFEAIDYETAPTNSTTNSVLAGVNHNLTEHLIVHVRGGESFRSLENEGNMASPYFEGSLRYVSSNHSLNWISSYGYESPTRTVRLVRLN